MLKVVNVDGQFGKHFALRCHSYLLINVLRYSKICDASSPPFFIFCLCSCFPLPHFWCHDDSIFSLSSPETNRSSSPLMKSVFGIENNPRNTGGCYEKRQWMQTSGTFVAQFCSFLVFFWRLKRLNKINAAAALWLHGLTSTSPGVRHVWSADLISTKANLVFMIHLCFQKRLIGEG